jgi:GMP synthase PP-ATPase subunit
MIGWRNDHERERDIMKMKSWRATMGSHGDEAGRSLSGILPVKSVGVTGDGRRHEPVIALRAVATVDFMSAHRAHLPDELLESCCRSRQGSAGGGRYFPGLAIETSRPNLGSG